MSTFLLEVGTEELPADFVDDAIKQWKERITKSLDTELLSYTAIEFYGTPRRLAVLIKDLPTQQNDREEEIKGPPKSAGFKNGHATPAAEGFARKQGVSIYELEVRETDKGEFIFVRKKIPGKKTAEILQELIPQWITGLEGRRFMRWGDGDLRFPRPIRWLVTLLDDTVLPIELINGSTQLNSDRISYGHRILSPNPIKIPTASTYLERLRTVFVEADREARHNTIIQQIEETAKQLGGVAEISPSLLEEVINLVEYPIAVAGKFDAEFLELPPEVIITVMVTHQRYFPVKTSEGLLPNFITIANGDPNKTDIIASGNERVIRARLADAQFFYKADCDEHLESYLPQLENVTFQEELGTMRDKVDRIMEISQLICDQLELDPSLRSEIESTAMLCKADLVTQMVYEFPELQGIMGRKYALVSGETENVAQGIFDHYLPRGADDEMPQTLTGQVVGLADRLDTLVSIFGLLMIPTGSSDPFALRRAANGVINITWNAQLSIDLVQILEQSSEDFVVAHPNKTSPLSLLQPFFVQRIQTLLQDDLKIDYDLVKAVLGDNDPEYTERALRDLLDVRDRALFLQEIRNNHQLDEIYETINRSTRLAAKGTLDTLTLEPTSLINPDLFEQPSEKAFYEGLIELLPQTQAAQAERDYQQLVNGLKNIAPVVSRFFDGEQSVLVMADDPQIRQNRLNLLGLLRNQARVIADFGAIVK
ncbi:glycine--tRNA ligase subunit beta [Aphanothece hegewaldii CCALA 016]|uniref:Glycine--tRNA ligase beta subunit n=1 Tax=Aphanothece hegewaldii CCALA 016 TaxID=2107694 RepID=A0A2T1M1P2_9CHRO|nr:glycine--tRNA ligase subunit beta [Aphanothece hegewaldii]PSF38636.1 glycine--tRNA ligase subunit beta [Aphanothece hegewaldii CCALA 016]